MTATEAQDPCTYSCTELNADKPNLRSKILIIQRNPNLSPKEKHQQIFQLFNPKSVGNGKNTPIVQKSHLSADPCQEYNPCEEDRNIDEAGDGEAGDGEARDDEIDPSSRERVKNMLRNLPIASEHFILSPGGARIRIPCSQLTPNTEDGGTKCEHYDRKCSMYAECCKKFYPCRLCHDNENGDHSLERRKVKVIRCRECHSIQLAGGQCRNINCGVKFADYHCDKCNLWRTPPPDQPEAGAYHCDKCNVCLIGRPGIDAEHCNECGFCMPMEKYKVHHCQAIRPDEICCICREGFETLGQAEKTKCGHVFHLTCMESYMHHDICCPICKRTLFDMTKTWQGVDTLRANEVIPEDYRNWRVRFLCNDCQTMTEDRISYIGNKCGTCASYNTSQEDIIKNEPDESPAEPV